MNADTLIKALDEATRAPGALELQLEASGKHLQDLGLSWPNQDSLARLLDAMNKAAALLEGYGKYVVGTPVEVEDLRAYFKAAAAICYQGMLAEGIATLAKGERLMPKDRIERWDALACTFREWARQVEGCKPSEAAAAPVPASGQETGQIAASTPAAAPNTIQHLNTNKNEQEQRRIFAALVKAGFIAGTDTGGASMLQPFLNAFNPAAPEQGRIIWMGTSSKAGSRGKPSPRQALDFVALMAGGIQGITPDFGRQIFPAIFPGLQCSDDTRQTFAKLWNRGGGSEYHGELHRIINAR